VGCNVVKHKIKQKLKSLYIILPMIIGESGLLNGSIENLCPSFCED